MKKIDSKAVTAEVKQIKQKLEQNKISKSQRMLIEKNILLLQVALQKKLKLKKIGSYALNASYNFQSIPEIDLLGIKFVNRQLYRTYLDEVNTKEHFTDCWICELNQEIYKMLDKNFAQHPNITLEWNVTKVKISADEIKEHRDSLIITFFENSQPVFKFILRTVISHTDNLPIFCDKERYQQTTAIELVKTYSQLNQVLIKKVDIIFLYLTAKYHKKFTRKEILMMKIFTLSDIQVSLMHNKYMRMWLTKAFYQIFPNKKLIDDLFITNKIYYQNQKPIKKIYQVFQLKNLRWVFNRTYTSVHTFLNHYLATAKHFVTHKKYTTGFVEFWHDSVVYLQSTNRASTYTKKHDAEKKRDSNLVITSKNVYPSDNNIGVFLVLLSYYQFKINYFRKGK